MVSLIYRWFSVTEQLLVLKWRYSKHLMLKFYAAPFDATQSSPPAVVDTGIFEAKTFSEDR